VKQVFSPSIVLIFVSVLICPICVSAFPLSKPDLDVTYIERTPRYMPGPWVYPDVGPQYMGIGNHRFTDEELVSAHKQWPAEGEKVKFIAHVINKSDTASKPTRFDWKIDGKITASGKIPSIKPWQEFTTSVTWNWKNGAHTVAFEADPKNIINELCEQNNLIEDRTDAYAFLMRVTPELYSAWKKKPNGMGSYSFEDWVQRHVKLMNGVLAGSKYPKSAPNGCLDRIRVDKFEVVPKDKMLSTSPQKFGYDGGWNFYDDNLGKENSWFDYHIKDDFVTRVDTGLIHELTHQIGAIDMYAIVIGSCWNHARDEDGDILAVGYQVKQPDMMGGGPNPIDFDGSPLPTLYFTPHPDGEVTVATRGMYAAYSEETVAGLNSIHGLRRGHFGLYLFDIPEESRIKVLDINGNPVNGAEIKVYQQTPQPGPQSIGEKPTFVGLTDSQGIFSLGSRPFGDINCVGLNGILYITIKARGHKEWRFLDICNFNIAKWRGSDKVWTAVFKTNIPPETAPEAPKNLRWAYLAPGKSGRIAWEPVKNAVGYRVYRLGVSGPNASFDPLYVKCLEVDGKTCEALADVPQNGDVPYYTVTAVDEQGRESAFAGSKGLTTWGPAGSAVVENDGSVVRVTLQTADAWVQMRSPFIAGQGCTVKFSMKTNEDVNLSSAGLILDVLGLGVVKWQLSEFSAGMDLADGKWHDLQIDLRARLDKLAAEKGVTPVAARTTWNSDWVVMRLCFGAFSDKWIEPTVFEFRNFSVKLD